MLANLGKDLGGADIENIFQNKLGARKRKDYTLTERLISIEKKEKKDKHILGSQNDGIGIEEDDLSSISSVKSTNELWETIEMNKGKDGRRNFAELINVIGSDSQRKTMKDRDRGGVVNHSDYENNEEVQQIIERYEMKLEKMKESNKLQVETLLDNIKSKTKDLLVQKSEEMKLRFEGEIKNLMAEISQDKTIIAEKDNEIARLNTLVHNQEMTINILRGTGALRIRGSRKESMEQQQHQHGAVDCDFSKDEIEVLRKEIESLKSLLLGFKKEDEKKGRELARAKLEINQITKMGEEKIEYMTQRFEVKKKELNDQMAVQQMGYNQLEKE